VTADSAAVPPRATPTSGQSQRSRVSDSIAPTLVRFGTAADWPACWAMDISYDTEYVWQLQSTMQANVSMSGFVRVRLPRAITLRDPLWGGTVSLPQPERGSLIIAEANGAIEGFALVVPDLRRAVDVLHMFAVRGHARRRGLGSRLVTTALDSARASGCRALCATVQARNYPAISALLATGFVVSGHDELFYPSSDVGLSFAHRLAHEPARRLLRAQIPVRMSHT